MAEVFTTTEELPATSLTDENITPVVADVAARF
jgi:hypothetical protein